MQLIAGQARDPLLHADDVSENVNQAANPPKLDDEEFPRRDTKNLDATSSLIDRLAAPEILVTRL